MRVKLLIAITLSIFSFSSISAERTDLVVDRVEVYSSKDKIPYIGSDGGSIPGATPLIVMRTSSSTYADWKFVTYGDSMDYILSLWLAAKLSGNSVFCTFEDRGNYWVECVGSGLEK